MIVYNKLTEPINFSISRYKIEQLPTLLKWANLFGDLMNSLVHTGHKIMIMIWVKRIIDLYKIKANMVLFLECDDTTHNSNKILRGAFYKEEKSLYENITFYGHK